MKIFGGAAGDDELPGFFAVVMELRGYGVAFVGVESAVDVEDFGIGVFFEVLCHGPGHGGIP